MTKKAKYVTTRRFMGAGILEVGSVIELTPAQAQHPLYRNRVRPRDVDQAPIVPSTKPSDQNSGGQEPEGNQQSLQGEGNLAGLAPKPWNQG